MKNNKGFTLVELLATIAILAIVASITLYIAISVINQAKEKTYQVTLNNITSNANNYLLERGNDLVFVKTVDERLEYQCLMVKNLVDMGYLDNKVTEAKVADNKNVDTADYIYIERDASTKTIIKSVYVVDSDSTYAHVCGVASNIFGKIDFSSKPNANTWAREKDVLITYTIKNVNDVNLLHDYQYYYSFNDSSNNKVFNNYVMKENAQVETVGNITAKIVKDDKTIISKVYQILKIDRDGPTVKLNNNPTGYLYNSATISLNVSDIPVGTDGINNSGVKYASFTKEDIEVTIGGTSITTFSLTKKDNNGNFDLVINDTTHSGDVNIRIKENTVFDNLDNGNKQIDLPLEAEWRKVAQIPTATGYCSNPTYIGSSQTIVKDSGEGYTWTNGASRTNAGSQDVTASLSSGYVWNDETITDKKVNCSISKKAITITAKDQTINYGGTISTGVGQVTAVTLATGDSLDSVTLTQSTTSATTSGAITPSVAIIKRDTTNVTSNYNITYSNGALTINKVAATITCSDKTYNGSEQTACSCSGGTIGGTYKATNYSSSAYTATCTGDGNHLNADSKTWAMGKKALAISAWTTNLGSSASYTRSDYATGVGSETITLTYTPYTNTGGEYTYSTSAGSGKYTLTLDSSNYSISSAGKFTINGKFECWHSIGTDEAHAYGEKCYSEPNGSSTVISSFGYDTWYTIDSKVTNDNKPLYCKYLFNDTWVDDCQKSKLWLHVKSKNCWVWAGYFEHASSTLEDPDTGACIAMYAGNCTQSFTFDGKKATCRGTPKKETSGDACYYICVDVTCTFTDGSGSFAWSEMNGGSC